MPDVPALCALVGAATFLSTFFLTGWVLHRIRARRDVRVKIEKRLNETDRCRVWINGHLVFDGQSLDAALIHLRDGGKE